VTPSQAGLWVALILLAGSACNRDSRPVVTGGPADGKSGAMVRTSDLVAGGRTDHMRLQNPYEGQKNVLAEGERYYGWFNCAGCHGAAGGGGIGPPLADNDWIYGGGPGQIFLTIVQGRPNGMPSFGGQIPDDQVWKIVAFVSSLSEHAASQSRTTEGSRAP
jgi:cytochrome c oxidase cbb3-type subunit III